MADNERTYEGVVGETAGKPKETIASWAGDTDLAREGRLQQVASEAERSPSRFTTAAIDAYLRVLRRPIDLAVGLLPGERTGPGAAARSTVDRFDATVRSLLGAALGDPELGEPARAGRPGAAPGPDRGSGQA